ncbi:FAD-linked oxidoreductase sorD [Pseudocercospora fuligena]|uniref:FAD-linked oxidoreductase sorD n=1 Tax=Pseudocercospora fuligena TaxID=685502 RepID=A0A8H6RLG4_9PEZI|nr:FAD-linked oxidoreductase sorD [Pseudocercospora fuligena]
MWASSSFLVSLAVSFAAALPGHPDVNAYASCIAAAVKGNSSLYAFPTTANYQTELDVYNLDHIYFPSAIAFPTCVDEVSALVQCAHKAGVAVQSLSGGHSYLNFGLGGRNGSLSIRLEYLNDFAYDAETQIASFGSGNLLGAVRQQLTALNRLPIFSSIPSIGTGGHLTIGGLGPGSRLHGLASDQIVQVQVVTANGAVVIANEEQYPDLFFAVRGAAWSFGIVTHFWIKTYDVVQQIDYSYLIPGNFSTSAQFLTGWQALISQKNLSHAFGSTVYVYEGFSLINGNFMGSQEEFSQVGLNALISQAIPTSALLGVLDKLNLTATIGLVSDFESTGLLSLLPSLPSSAVLELVSGIQKLAPALKTGNTQAIVQGIQSSNSTTLKALISSLNATQLPSIFSNLATSGLLDIVTNTTDLQIAGAVLSNLNLTSIFGLISEAAASPLLTALPPNTKFSTLFSTLFSSHTPGHFYGKSLKYTDETLMTPSTIQSVYSYLDSTEKGTALWFVLFDLAGGAINEVSTNSSAYWHRDALVWLQSYVVNLSGPVTKTSKDFLNNLNGVVQNSTKAIDESAYAGYVDDGLKDAQKAYWGGNVPYLQKVKGVWDSTDVFRNPHSVVGVVFA